MLIIFSQSNLANYNYIFRVLYLNNNLFKCRLFSCGVYTRNLIFIMAEVLKVLPHMKYVSFIKGNFQTSN